MMGDGQYGMEYPLSVWPMGLILGAITGAAFESHMNGDNARAYVISYRGGLTGIVLTSWLIFVSPNLFIIFNALAFCWSVVLLFYSYILQSSDINARQ